MLRNEASSLDDRDLKLRWSGRWTLTRRILAINIFALATLAGSLLYLDSFRERLLAQARDQAAVEVRAFAAALQGVPAEGRQAMLTRLGTIGGGRLRLYRADGPPLDSWAVGEPTYRLRDPRREPWQKDVARLLDRGVNAIVGGGLPEFVEPEPDRLAAWPEARNATAGPTTMLRQAPDLTPLISAATRLPGGIGVLLLTDNAREITRVVRNERLTLALVLLATLLASTLLSFFLARTIARPLRRLAIAAHRVRLGRSREVKVPRLPSRRDEIGLLARAIHDMSQSLRQRIDNSEAFAADVTHELKNPLASLRSAVEGLATVKEPALQAQLLDIVRGDVARLDRLIVDIAEVSRLDAELSRARFTPIDVGALIRNLVQNWEARVLPRKVRLAFARPRKGTAIVAGEPSRLARAIDNLIDNAISFSPDGGLVEIGASRVGGDVLIRVDDEGPGVPDEVRLAIFDRFHTDRPAGEPFGRHSGLGLSIARAVVEGHGGSVEVLERDDAPTGARFVIRLPADIA